MFTQDNLDQVLNGTVVDQSGEKIGKVGDIYFDDVTNKPSWVTVNTGFFGTSSSFIPLDNATSEGDTIRVPFSKEKVKDAPRVDADRHLSVDEERELYAYYGSDFETGYAEYQNDTTRGAVYANDPDNGADNGADAGAGFAAGDPDRGADHGADANADGIVLHEERVNVGTQRREVGKVRLRKHVVTEQQTVTVPVSHDEVRIEREKIVDGQPIAGGLREGRDETAAEVVLTEEQVVVNKEAVPVERVALGKETVTEQQKVTETVAREEVEIDRDGGREGLGHRIEDDARGLGDKIKDKLDRDNDGKVL